MSTLKPALIALSLVLVAPMAAQASEITLVPAVKLQIGDRDNSGHYWDGGRWRDHDWWEGPFEPSLIHILRVPPGDLVRGLVSPGSFKKKNT